MILDDHERRAVAAEHWLSPESTALGKDTAGNEAMAVRLSAIEFTGTWCLRSVVLSAGCNAIFGLTLIGSVLSDLSRSLDDAGGWFVLTGCLISATGLAGGFYSTRHALRFDALAATMRRPDVCGLEDDLEDSINIPPAAQPEAVESEIVSYEGHVTDAKGRAA